jgi:cell fate (sporulation/competence/biofilm development) regulator YlbF (YheA/YmcA/DUF963 family)
MKWAGPKAFSFAAIAAQSYQGHRECQRQNCDNSETNRAKAAPHKIQFYSLAQSRFCWQISPAASGDQFKKHMCTQDNNNDAILQKARELCQAILDAPNYKTTRRHIEEFMSNPQAQEQYRSLSEKGQALHEKQHQGEAIDPVEIQAFEKEREAFFANPIAAGFVEAQEQMQAIQEMVSQHVDKTFELGRIPEKADFRESGCCGGHNHEGGEPHEHGGEGCCCH